MTALLEALIGYVFYELEPEERNMNSVMTLLLMLESQGDGPNSVSQLDLLFDDLSINKPNSFAAKQYKLYKMAPGKTAQSINVSLGLRMSAFNIPSIANICADDTIDLRGLGSEKKSGALCCYARHNNCLQFFGGSYVPAVLSNSGGYCRPSPG